MCPLFRGKVKDKLKTITMTDELTGLLNRRGFMSFAKHEFKRARRSGQGGFIIYADVDDFKHINDTFGHHMGDMVLIEISKIFKEIFRESDIVSRLGGDEFAILLVNASSASKGIILSRLQDRINAYNLRKDRVCDISLSTGVAYYDPKHPSTVSDVLSRADSLMYKGKAAKKVSHKSKA